MAGPVQGHTWLTAQQWLIQAVLAAFQYVASQLAHDPTTLKVGQCVLNQDKLLTTATLTGTLLHTVGDVLRGWVPSPVSIDKIGQTSLWL